jgi:hypothetical protein
MCWADAIKAALAQIDPETKRQRLDLVAESLVMAGLAGDVSALKELGDRVDGKVPQRNELVTPTGPLLITQIVLGALPPPDETEE